MITVFSSTGCLRCRIVKEFLASTGLEYIEYDIKTDEGNAAFKAFYRENRPAVRRDDQGIFFPIVRDGDTIVQDAGSSLAWFIAGAELSSIIRPNNLGHGWTGGLKVKDYGAELNAAFLETVRLMKKGGLSIEAETDGANPSMLTVMLKEKLLDRLIFRVGTPASRPAEADWNESLKQASVHAADLEFRLLNNVSSFVGEDGAAPDKVLLSQTAEAVRTATGDPRTPCTLVKEASSELNLLMYRTAVRRWLVSADIA